MRLLVFLILFSHFGILTIGFVAKAEFREETAALESMYETRARTVLDTLISPEDYSMVIAVQIESDEDKFKAIEEEYQNQGLPGMPGTGSLDTLVIANKLHELKNKVEVQIIMSSTISKDKEDAIKVLLSSKLHLDEQNGDTIRITRASLPSAKPEEPIPSILPELSWKMWALVIVLALLALAGLLLSLSKRQSKKMDNLEENKSPLENPQDSQPNQSNLTEESRIEKTQSIDELLFEHKRHLINYATQYPSATIRALTEHFQKGNESDLLSMCEVFGWDLSKKLFSGFSPRIWARLSHLVSLRNTYQTQEELQKGFENCYRIVLARYLEMGDRDQKDPFSFVWRLSPQDRSLLISGEAPYHIALMCLDADMDQVSEVLNSLSEFTQELVTIEISRLKNVPQESIDTVVDSLYKKLKTFQDKPIVQAQGPALAANLLRALPPEKELSLFHKLQVENAKDAFEIRKLILIFKDLIYVPGELINELGSSLDINILSSALRICPVDVKEYVLKTLPPKRASMVERDLELDLPNFTQKDAAKAQREVVLLIESLMKAHNLELSQIIPKELSQSELKMDDPAQEGASAA